MSALGTGLIIKHKSLHHFAVLCYYWVWVAEVLLELRWTCLRVHYYALSHFGESQVPVIGHRYIKVAQ